MQIHTPDEVATMVKRMNLTEHEMRYMLGRLIESVPDDVMKAADAVNLMRYNLKQDR